MAYENGYNILDYFGDSIEKYKKDNMIFTKALTIINTFQTRSDWPHCIDELNIALNPIMGESFIELGDRGFYLDDDSMEWPEDIPENYQQDALSFYRTIETIVSQFYFKRTEPLKLFSIVYSKDLYKNISIVRFSRNDGQYIDFEMNDHDLIQTVSSLRRILEQDIDEE
ncbi:hypothetical protein ACQYAC_19375 [Bacillus sp. MM09(2025)]|uniref:hypothetical protein n=1 Tax=Bacillus sp. MM09(2025) TaxID=3422493 RepID=UPI003D2BF955